MFKPLLIIAASFLFNTNLFAQTIAGLPLGFTSIAELGFTKNIDFKNGTYSYAMHTINGMQLNKHFFAGIGAGYERGEGGGNNLPVFADARYYFGKNTIKPFVNQQIGYMFHIFSQEFTETFNTKGMFSASTSLGLAIPVKFVQSLNFNLGYRIMHRSKVKFTYDERSFTYHNLIFKAGVTF